MASICFHFRAHQPNRLKPYTFFDIGYDHFYEDDHLNKHYLDVVSETCYLPLNERMLQMIEEHGGAFRFSLSLSGTFIEQMENHRPDVLESFKKLVASGGVDLCAETYYHSLASEYSVDEFVRQIKLHENKIMEHFGIKPKVLRNTELIYANRISNLAEDLGYLGVLTEGVDWHLNGRNPNMLYKAPGAEKVKLLLRNHKLTDDICFRFCDTQWQHHPLTAEKYAQWLAEAQGDVVNIFMDYETIGEHLKKETGIFDFLLWLPRHALKYGNVDFKTVSEVASDYRVKGIYDILYPISWSDAQRDLSSWNGNAMQDEALTKLYSMEYDVKASGDQDLLHVWGKLQTSDHFYYICTKPWGGTTVNEYFSPYSSAYEGYIYYMNALADLEITVNDKKTQAGGTWQNAPEADVTPPAAEKVRRAAAHREKRTQLAAAPPTEQATQPKTAKPKQPKTPQIIDIKGIGKVYDTYLKEIGITTLDALIKMKKQQWNELEKKEKGITEKAEHEQWIEQAKKLLKS